MNKVGIERARWHLADARAAYIGLLRSKYRDHAAFGKCWHNFLIAADGVYEQLAGAVDQNGSSKGWFDARIHERRTDPLLRYVHHARNVEYHTSLSSTAVKLMVRFRVTIAGGPGPKPLPSERDEARINKTLPPLRWIRDDGARILRRQLMQQDVVHRGVTYPVPHQHLGVNYSSLYPADIAKLTVDYLRQMIREASRLA